MNALYKGCVVSAVASLAILYPVTDYVLGLDNNFYPKHSKRYIELQTQAGEAINSYINDVSTKNFPKKEHSTNLKPNVLKSLL